MKEYEDDSDIHAACQLDPAGLVKREKTEHEEFEIDEKDIILNSTLNSDSEEELLKQKIERLEDKEKKMKALIETKMIERENNERKQKEEKLKKERIQKLREKERQLIESLQNKEKTLSFLVTSFNKEDDKAHKNIPIERPIKSREMEAGCKDSKPDIQLSLRKPSIHRRDF